MPFETTGIYYRPINKHILNSSKISRIWNVVANNPEYNMPLYDIIFFGKLENKFGRFKPENLNKKYFAEITFNLILKDFFEYAREMSSIQHKKYTDYQGVSVFNDLKIENSEISFENKRWKCNGFFNGFGLNLKVEDLKDGTEEILDFNYFR